MTTKTLLAAFALAVAPAVTAFACPSHSAHITCADGMTYDSDARGCVPNTTS